MAIPVIYNVRSVRARWSSAVVAILGIAGTVGVFVAMLALAHGFKATLVSSGSPDNALVLRAGSGSEMNGAVTLENDRDQRDDYGRGSFAAPGLPRHVPKSDLSFFSTARQ